ncbi:hypothetical protein [Allorhizobium undicola]|uniref:hypothetical protein n=1 Tax=Allorhizobium undicola TaxID=78527 RepID=UPI000485C5BD|nr:hypothetical protein [Allorhizobium undicola]
MVLVNAYYQFSFETSAKENAANPPASKTLPHFGETRIEKINAAHDLLKLPSDQTGSETAPTDAFQPIR